MKHRHLSAILVLLVLIGPPCSASAPIIGQWELDQRHVGYLLGDRVPRTVVVEHDPRWSLQATSLPEPGPQAYWLELRGVDTRTRIEGARAITRIELDYQNFYAPIAVRQMQLPALSLQWVKGEERVAVKFPKWAFTTAPLREVSSLRTGQGESWLELRPDREPPVQPLQPLWRHLAVTASLALLAAVLLCWQASVFPFHRRPRRPFADAARVLRRNRDDLASQYRQLHAAFDRSAGRVLMAEDVDEFLHRNPHFEPHRQAIKDWFESSRRLFFGTGTAEAEAHRHTLQLAQALSRVERAA